MELKTKHEKALESLPLPTKLRATSSVVFFFLNKKQAICLFFILFMYLVDVCTIDYITVCPPWRKILHKYHFFKTNLFDHVSQYFCPKSVATTPT